MAETEQKAIEDSPKLNARQAALQLLVNSNIPLKEASKLLGYSYHGAGNIVSKKKLNKLKLAEDKEAQNIASRTIKALAAGLIPADSVIEAVKDSTALEASKYIHNFIEQDEASKAQEQNFCQVNVNLTLINKGMPADDAIECQILPVKVEGEPQK